MIILLAIALSVLLFFLPAHPAYSASLTDTSPANPGCEYQAIDINNSRYAGHPFANPQLIESENGELQTILTVTYSDRDLAGCQVHLRSYNGQLVGPTLRVKPGDTINLKLINDLPPEPHLPEDPLVAEESPDGCRYELVNHTSNEPHNFNTTNFHTHGLHVDPGVCSDNVLRVMNPRRTAAEPAPEYTVRIQVPPDHPAGTFWYHAHLHGATALQVSSGMAGALIVEGGLDNLPEIAAAEDKVFVLQQIAYDRQGEIENYDEFKPEKWENSQRRITINGQIVPVIEMRPGEVQRWRFIHGGVRERINIELRHGRKSLPLHEIAVDGIALGKIDSWKAVELEPGYRSDVLVKAKNLLPGQTSQQYDLIDAPSSRQESLFNQGEIGSILARVIVRGKSVDMPLPSDRQIAMVKQQDVPPDILDEELTTLEPTQTVAFSIKQIPSGEYQFNVNDRAFSPEDERKLELNKAEIWQISTDSTRVGKERILDKHPFHIHVNSFQHDRQDPNHQTERIWRDTLMVVADEPQTIRTRYTDFTGKFVLHCHILDHEDQGMMQAVEIVKQPQKVNLISAISR
ncbi:MAG: multicopper oxidase family protein [Pleurocapsa sp. MO_226.B13]|nr:multicopper oxidase family protein [Pleurocapsa sp. MO_226.B13]